MQCEQCGQPAMVQFTDIVAGDPSGRKTEKHLCSFCAVLESRKRLDPKKLFEIAGLIQQKATAKDRGTDEVR